MLHTAGPLTGLIAPIRSWRRFLYSLPGIFVAAVSLGTPLAAAQSNLSDNIAVELLYPAELNAGGPFTVYARFSNNSDIAINVPVLAGYWSVNSNAGQYASTQCYHACNLSGSETIAPGRQALVRIADLYYRGEQFVSGTLSISASPFHTTTATGENLVIEGPGSHTITVTLPAGAKPENKLVTVIPERAELELMDLLASGDQLVLHDPNTGGDWLRFSASTGLSEAELYQALSAHGALAGFRIASITEVETLVLNYLHSKGMAVQARDLYDNPDAALRPSIGELVELVQPTSPEFVTTPQALGIVRDRLPRAPDGQIQYQTFTLEGSTTPSEGWQTVPGGAILKPVSQNDWPGSLAPRGGVWLVLGAGSEPKRPLARASFHDRELVIPNVAIDGNHYRVHLELLSYNPERFRVTSMTVVDAQDYAAQFDASTGSIQLHGALSERGNTTRIYDLTLALVAGAEPPMLEVISLTPASIYP